FVARVPDPTRLADIRPTTAPALDLHAPAAATAEHQAGKQHVGGCFAFGPWGALPFGGGEQLGRDDRLVCFLRDLAAAPDLAEVGPRLDHPRERVATDAPTERRFDWHGRLFVG